MVRNLYGVHDPKYIQLQINIVKVDRHTSYIYKFRNYILKLVTIL